MTIKTRNRITLSFFIFSSLICLAELALLLYQFLSGKLLIPQTTQPQNASTLFIFKNMAIFAILGILLENLYTCLTTLFTMRAFEKTQTTEIVYFTIFLFACLCDSSRIIITLFHISGTYSNSLMIVGNLTLCSRILVPLSLMCTVIMNSEDQRQKVERNSVIILIVGIFLSRLIPLNNSTIEPNFMVSYSYATTIKISTYVIHIANIFTLFMRNRNQKSTQRTTIGYIMLVIGNTLMFNCINLFSLVIGFSLLCIGTFVFLRAIHKYYLWND